MKEYIHIKEIDSTNKYLKDLLAEQSVDEGTVVYTDFQIAGRGQRGNVWESESGKNLLFSIILYPNMIRADEQFIISQIVSLAIKECLDVYTENISIKWPNDIYWKERKICGILIENSLIENRINQSIIGIGLNINQVDFESDLPNPISLAKITGKIYNIKNILQIIADKIMTHYQDIKNSSKESIIQNYKNSLFHSNGFHLYNDGEKDFYARIKDIEPTGVLILETEEGKIRNFAFKEVKYILS